MNFVVLQTFAPVVWDIISGRKVKLLECSINAFAATICSHPSKCKMFRFQKISRCTYHVELRIEFQGRKEIQFFFSRVNENSNVGIHFVQ